MWQIYYLAQQDVTTFDKKRVKQSDKHTADTFWASLLFQSRFVLNMLKISQYQTAH